MLFDASRLNVKALKSLVKKLSERYTSAIQNDRPLKDVKEIKKAIHYVEKKIVEAETDAQRLALNPSENTRDRSLPASPRS